MKIAFGAGSHVRRHDVDIDAIRSVQNICIYDLPRKFGDVQTHGRFAIVGYKSLYNMYIH